MIKETNTFELEALQINNAEGTIFEIKDFDRIKELSKSIVNSFNTSIIQDTESNNDAKEFRAKCNKAKNQIKDLRLSTSRSVFGKFEAQAKELEAIFDTKQAEIGEMIRAYNDSKKEKKASVSTKTYSLKLTYTLEKLTQKIIDFCKENNITVEEI